MEKMKSLGVLRRGEVRGRWEFISQMDRLYIFLRSVPHTAVE